MILLALIFTATFHPPSPTVGDLVTIDFPRPVTLDRSPDFEVVSQQGSRVVLRTFQPKPLVLSGVAGGVRFRGLTLPVRSVLKPKDKLEPAPLRPPVDVPYPRLPLIAIGSAALAAAAVWTAVLVRARRPAPATEREKYSPDPEETFRHTVAALRARSAEPARWAALADATRLYLASLSPHLGIELTSSQFVARVDSQHVAAVATILRQGDLEKFSPWGAPPADFECIAEQALGLIPAPFPEEATAA